MKNPVFRSVVIGAVSALVAIAIAFVGTFVLPIPSSGEHIEFLFYVMLLIGLPVGTLLTLVLADPMGTVDLWNAVAIAALFAVLNWTLVGLLYGLFRRWLTRRKDVAAPR